uniref:Uncharacterized protein n=1 Tax=Anguilla anguilla TaxID=7936 RepID=A0A0E9SFC7_ANGAN
MFWLLTKTSSSPLNM